jgi:hypothetical protein
MALHAEVAHHVLTSIEPFYRINGAIRCLHSGKHKRDRSGKPTGRAFDGRGLATHSPTPTALALLANAVGGTPPLKISNDQ